MHNPPLGLSNQRPLEKMEVAAAVVKSFDQEEELVVSILTTELIQTQEAYLVTLMVKHNPLKETVAVIVMTLSLKSKKIRYTLATSTKLPQEEFLTVL